MGAAADLRPSGRGRKRSRCCSRKDKRPTAGRGFVAMAWLLLACLHSINLFLELRTYIGICLSILLPQLAEGNPIVRFASYDPDLL